MEKANFTDFFAQLIQKQETNKRTLEIINKTLNFLLKILSDAKVELCLGCHTFLNKKDITKYDKFVFRFLYPIL